MTTARLAVSVLLCFPAICPATGEVVSPSPPLSPAAADAALPSLAAPVGGRPSVGVWFSSGGDAMAAPLRLARWKDAVDFVLTPALPEEIAFCGKAGVPWAGEIALPASQASLGALALPGASEGSQVLGWSLATPSARRDGGSAPAPSGYECQSVNDQVQKLYSADPGRVVVTAVPDPFSREEDLDFEACYRAGSAVGVALRPGLTWDARPESVGARGLQILRAGDAVRMSLPAQPAFVFAEWSVTLPPAARLKFRYRSGDQGGDGVKLAVRVLAGLRPEVVWEQEVPARAPGFDGFHEADVDLGAFGGNKIKLRLEAGPGDARQTKGDTVDWADPMLTAAGGEASLIEHANWWQMRTGYRPVGAPRDVVTGVTESTFDPEGCELKLGLISARCAVTGKPFLLNGLHPTGDTDTASPLSLAAFWARVLPYQPASVIFYRAGAQEPESAARDVEPLVSEFARWRNFLQMAQPLGRITRTRPLTLFASPESGSRLDGARALERFGLDIRPLNVLGDDEKLRNIVVWAEYLNQEAGIRLARFLRNPGKGQKALVFCGSLQGPGAAALGDLLPFRFEQAVAREVVAALPSNATLPLWTPVKPVWIARPGWEPVKGADGETLAAVRGSLLLVAGLPLARPDAPENALGQLASKWLAVQPYSILDSGFVKVARGDVRADSEGVWSMEGAGTITVPSTIIAYDMIERQAAPDVVNGPAALYCFPKRGARLVDAGVCFVRDQKMEGSDLVVRLECPTSLSDVSGYQVIFWTPKTPAPSLESGGAWTVSVLGNGFWKAACGKPGQYTLKIAGAMLPKPPKTFNPMDH